MKCLRLLLGEIDENNMREIKQFRLTRDSLKCKNCGTCSRLLPDFIRVYNGILLISKSNYRQEHVRLAAESVIDACPEKAIRIVMHISEK